MKKSAVVLGLLAAIPILVSPGAARAQGPTGFRPDLAPMPNPVTHNYCDIVPFHGRRAFLVRITNRGNAPAPASVTRVRIRLFPFGVQTIDVPTPPLAINQWVLLPPVFIPANARAPLQFTAEADAPHVIPEFSEANNLVLMTCP